MESPTQRSQQRNNMSPALNNLYGRLMWRRARLSAALKSNWVK
ncbi:hypothetical protein ANACAC_03540 [Anaerostipes caccae L1-92]|uniref:Uncharacterized protein n=1 Tax=Anaerostipes caccae (strain DSM 14662 / CCUG 47493 / JCM 13470 / NCIMB 13811 / L1-92) TaxID=411490 RepID=B0MIT5_ANACD|nr:hypothetical protein ANACAC_03540 [Anaerostipes caccae L1-92]